MRRHAIIGSYASDKLLITSFDVQRSNERALQQSKTRKLVGTNRQNLRITLEGQLRCTTFDELDNEVDALLDALNNREIMLMIGATPDRFYRVSWSGSSLARRGGAGGPHLPVSLDFDVLDEGAIVGLPVSYGAIKVDGINTKVNNLGLMDSGPTLINQRTFFAKGSTGNILGNMADGTVVVISKDANKGYADLWIQGVMKKSVTLPLQDEYHIGLVFGSETTTLYVDGRPYVFNLTYSPFRWRFYQVNSFYGAFPFEAPDYFMSYLASKGKDEIIKVKSLVGGENIDNLAMDNTPIAIHATITTASTGKMTLGDFGASFAGQASDWLLFNGITNDINASRPELLDGIGYNNRFTLLPRLKKGRNTFDIQSGIISYLMMWRDMVR